MSRRYFWPKMRRDIAGWSKECLPCAATRSASQQSPPLQPIESSRPWEIVGVDLAELGLTTRGNRYMIVFIDHFSKYVKARAIPDKTAPTIAEEFLDQIVLDRGSPEALLSDRVTEFLNDTLGTLLPMIGTIKLNTIGHKPQTNGITERMNQTLEKMLSRSTLIKTEWDRRLKFVCFAYNIAEHSSTGESPYFVVNGSDPRWPSAIDPHFCVTKNHVDVDDYKTDMRARVQETIERVRQRLKAARDRQKAHYDRTHRVVNTPYRIGDRVMLFDPAATAKSKHPKLEWSFHGPYRIIKLTPCNAELQLIDRLDEPIVFAPISRLRRAPRELPDVSYTVRRHFRPATLPPRHFRPSTFAPRHFRPATLSPRHLRPDTSALRHFREKTYSG
jgi:hypothetical protein